MQDCGYDRAQAQVEALRLTRKREPTPNVEKPKQIINFHANFAKRNKTPMPAVSLTLNSAMYQVSECFTCIAASTSC